MLHQVPLKKQLVPSKRVKVIRLSLRARCFVTRLADRGGEDQNSLARSRFLKREESKRAPRWCSVARDRAHTICGRLEVCPAPLRKSISLERRERAFFAGGAKWRWKWRPRDGGETTRGEAKNEREDLAEREKEQAEYTCGSRRPTGREREPVDAE